MKRDITALISQMTLEEKAGMCSGTDYWRLQGVERLGIPQVSLADGPHGLRKGQTTVSPKGMRESIPAVCFPAACAVAASFDRDILNLMGEALGEESQAEDISVLLGPGVNIKRSPLCGRNFEYFSEDPLLTGELAASYIKGIQSKYVGASLKHYAVNNQEYRRMVISAEVDEQTLREIYLQGFEIAVKKAQPWTVMCAFNKVNGTFASEHKQLLNDILRDEWGFEGYVMSDWSAVYDRISALVAGLELEMPSSHGVTNDQIVNAVKAGTLQEAILDQVVARILNIIFRFVDNRSPGVFNKERDHALAVKIEEASGVLLKNEGGILPLKKGDAGQKILIIGEFAQKPRYQGGGSSHINAFRITGALETIKHEGIPGITYTPGFYADKDEKDEALFNEAVQAAKNADAAVIFAGLPDAYESEGFDREHMDLPRVQNELIDAITAVQKNTVVVLHNGSPVEMPWADKVPAILELYLGGQGVGEAAVHLLFGDVNPSGKLPETFPLRLEDNPSYLNFPGTMTEVHYREGIYVGYRYYDKKKLPVRFPFGHGLSYTTFAYSNLRLDKKSINAGESLTVKVDIANTGSRAGKEVVQVYVRDNTPNRPDKELRGFAKLSLNPGETKTAEIVLEARAFEYYNQAISSWYAAGGVYEILVGTSSRNILLQDTVEVIQPKPLPFKVTVNTYGSELTGNPKIKAVFEAVIRDAVAQYSAGNSHVTFEVMLQLLNNRPLRAARRFLVLTDEQLNDMVYQINNALL